MALAPNVVDVPLLLLNQLPGKHAGPIGRLTSMINAQIRNFLPSSQAVPQRIVVEAREGFQSLSPELRSSVTGAVVSGSWSNPEVLAELGHQLLSICDSIPRVFTDNGSWTHYDTVRVVTNKLTEDVLHTTNHVLQAPDSARIGAVTCSVWTETVYTPGGLQYNPMVSFRADDGAWVRTPFATWTNPPGAAATMARVVSDGTFFWVFSPIGTVSKIGIWVYDVHGVQVATDTTSVPLKWAVSPGYWDIAAPLPGASPFVALVQPTNNTTVGANVGATWWKFTVSGAVITVTTGVLTGSVAAKCQGPVAFMGNDGTIARMYIATVGAANTVFAYETDLNFTTEAEYAFGAVLNGSGIPDSLTGWAEANGGTPIAHVAYSMLSNFSPPAGPANDPGLRYTRSYACTRAGAVTLTNQTNGVLLSSRAFRIDQDWYAATYYQSGGGQARTGTPIAFPFTMNESTDYLIGSAIQPLVVNYFDLDIGSPQRIVANAVFDFATAAPATRMAVIPSQAIASIAHNAGDSAVAATTTWTLLNAAFSNTASIGGISAFNSYLRVSGSSHAANNADFRVIRVISPTVVQTEPVSTTGTQMVNDTLAGVTVQLVSTTTIAVTTEVIGDVVPQGAENYFLGTANVTGASNSANNGTYNIIRLVAFGVFPNWPGTPLPCAMFICTPIGTNTYDSMYPGPGTVLFTPTNVNTWGFSGQSFNDQDVGQTLVVSGTAKNDGSYPITGHSSMTGVPTSNLPFYLTLVTGNQASIAPQVVLPPLPTMSIALTDPSQAFHMHVAAAAFDASWKGAYISIFDDVGVETGAIGFYQVVNVLGPADIQLIPVDGKPSHRTSMLSIDADASISVTKTNNQPSAVQPCWYLMPLSVNQRAAGRWDWSIAFADWRFDGETKANLGTFERNNFPLALSSVVPSAAGQQFVLPYRAQSFTAGQVPSGVQTQTGLSLTAQSTVGLKLFDIAAAPGQPIAGANEMLLPGPQASQFSASGFSEDGINLGFEEPFVVSIGTTAAVLALTLGVTYQYVVVAELTNESGDRVWSTVSQTLEVTLRGTQNQITIGGRMPGPTNRLIGVSIYRTSIAGGTPTVQHYKITNDLDVNGTGFTFTSVNGGAAFDTWQFVDSVPDPQILSNEVVYTDQGFLQRFPAPACSQGISGWKARDWLVGYDGAVWMSAEKVEGDATWWNPAFRYTAFGDDEPLAVGAVDSYLIVLCTNSVWAIPAAQFPGPSGKGGSLPTPERLPYPMGCTGYAATINAGTPGAGVAYSSTAGGIWMITRQLSNLYLSQPTQDDLKLGVSGLAVDGQQRLIVATNTTSLFVYDQLAQAWYRWVVPTVARLVARKAGRATYQDTSSVSPQVAGAYLDDVDDPTGIAPDVTLSLSQFGNVRGLKAVWACQIVGEYKGPHRLNAVMSYPDDDQPPTTFGPFTPDPARPYIFEINPMVEEATSFGVRVFVDFVGVVTPGNSMSLELLSFEVGLEPTLAKVRDSQRIPGG